MWQNKVNNILAVWIIALAFLGFSDSLHRVLLVITGLTMVILSIFGKSLIKSSRDLLKEVKENEKISQPIEKKGDFQEKNNETNATKINASH